MLRLAVRAVSEVTVVLAVDVPPGLSAAQAAAEAAAATSRRLAALGLRGAAVRVLEARDDRT